MLKEEIVMTYAEKVKILREKLFLSQSELANLLGVSLATVNRWENNKFEPTIKIKRKLNDLFIKNKIGK